MFKFLSVSGKIYAFCMIILGGLLLIWPDNALRTAAYAAGIMVMAGGIASVLAYFRRRIRTGIFSLISGIIVIAVGFWIFSNPEKFVGIFPTLFGFIILLSGILNLFETFSLTRAHYKNWWVSLLASIISIAMGLILINHAFGIVSIMTRLVGAFLIYNGFSDIWIIRRVDQHVNAWKNAAGASGRGGSGRPKYDTSDPDIIDAEDYREL